MACCEETKAKVRAHFGGEPTEEQAQSYLEGQLSPEVVAKAKARGFKWSKLLQLIFTYGPTVIDIVKDLFDDDPTA